MEWKKNLKYLLEILVTVILSLSAGIAKLIIALMYTNILII